VGLPIGMTASARWRHRHRDGSRRAVALLFVLSAALPNVSWAEPWTFTDVTTAAGILHQHGNTAPASTFEQLHAGGVAAGDYDGDGWVDLYAVRGTAGANLLYRNRGDGTFEERAAAAGVAITGEHGSGPTFADYDGDGRLDLLVLGVDGFPTRLFHNLGDGTFADVTAASGLVFTRNSVSAAFGDYDRDGDLDLFVTHWSAGAVPGGPREHLWRNDGGVFTDVGVASGIVIENAAGAPEPSLDYTFTPNFADLDDDGWPDIVVAADYSTSQVFHNRGDATFVDVTDQGVVTDEFGMGAAVCDYDHDGHLDWFVSSIGNPPHGGTGNRLYRNRGDGTLEDATEAAGVREGYWGWGSTFADVDNDGHPDLFHVNGYVPLFSVWGDDPARLFHADGDGTFTERAAELGVDDRGLGRGVVAFDYDRDGDLDLLVANSEGPPKLFRNDGGNAFHHLTVRLAGQPPNTEGIGSRVRVTAGGVTQTRELRAGSNYVSQDPAEAHFGLGVAPVADQVRVHWLSGGTTTLTNVAANQMLVVSEPAPGLCGNGVVESGPTYAEDCDLGAANGAPGSCCLVTCTFATAAHICRDAAGACDAPETCTGTSDVCPAADLKRTTVCRPAGGPCDLPETCDGIADTCPADAKHTGTCRPVTDACDVAESCDGVHNGCPADAVIPNGVTCRPAAGVCDVAETCDGISAACPADDVAPETLPCRGAAGACDAPEHCDGTGVECPADALAVAGSVCRDADGPCDASESCDGLVATCPADVLLPGGTPCPGDAGACAVGALCSGTAASCPAEVFQPAGTACGDDGNVCTRDECDGAGGCIHPATEAGVTCRPSLGPCDPAEACDGASTACPADGVAPLGTVCRPEAGDCDLRDFCDGSSPVCPPDVFAPPTRECRGSKGWCDVAEHCSGSEATCPDDAFAAAGTVCRPPASDCDAPDTCTGTEVACPLDLDLPDGAPCVNGLVCSIATCQAGACIGTTSPGCLHDDFQCYRAIPGAGALPFRGVDGLMLTDAFETGVFKAPRVRHLCSPARAAGVAVVDPATHLESYLARPAAGEPRHVPQTNLLVENRLGSLRVDTRKADLLFVPTAVDPAAPPAAPAPGSHEVDRFKCWQVRVSPNSFRFPKGVRLAMEDGFTGGPITYDVKAPRHLCLPVDQNGEGMVHPRRALLCYKVKPSSGEPRHEPRVGLRTANQFGDEALATVKEEELCLSSEVAFGQGVGHSVARQWNEEILDAIRIDTPRPTVHARNLFHLSAAMWDAWRAYGGGGSALFLDESHEAADPNVARAIAMSFAAYRVLSHRYAFSVSPAQSQAAFDARMTALGLDPSYTSVVGDNPAAVGNRIGAAVIAFGASDGANEAANYGDPSYAPQNGPLIVKLPGTIMAAPNAWQPLALDVMIAQNGIPIPGNIQGAIGMRWNQVAPFALTRDDPEALYLDPGPPPRLGTPTDAEFKAQAVEVVRRASELTPDDDVFVDISPGAFGNNPLGTNDGTGHPENPATGEPYPPQVVRRGDFGRVLAEFWADGPHSETPPGHWNTLANYVSDQLPEKRIGGSGPVVSDLEWDAKLYLALNGAVHDAAIVAWGTKRHYDSARPISMIRYLGGLGQSSDPEGPSHHPDGLPLVPGLIEVVTAASAAPGERHEHLAAFEGEIAVRAWPGEPADPATSYSGVQWVRAGSWVPYQRKTFVTPAFAAYTSGHSTFSRAAAEVLTRFTGSAYFPGGLGEFVAEADAYLAFERGPSAEVRLQWGTYYDAADQAGQSRLWGGIHIAADDFHGRITGSAAGIAAWERASALFAGNDS